MVNYHLKHKNALGQYKYRVVKNEINIMKSNFCESSLNSGCFGLARGENRFLREYWREFQSYYDFNLSRSVFYYHYVQRGYFPKNAQFR